VSRDGGEGAIAATVKVTLPLGPHIVYECEVGNGTPIKVSLPRQFGVEIMNPGDKIFLRLASPVAGQIFAIPAPGANH
jgi:hypothetical protein